MIDVQAVVSDGHGVLSLRQFSLGAPERGEVLIKIMASGVCHTDWDVARCQWPFILGHEGAGIVAAVGPEVDNLSIGDRVVLNWAKPCGTCYYCERGLKPLCENAADVPHERRQWPSDCEQNPAVAFGLGTMATHTVVAQEAVCKIPENSSVSFDGACITGCGVMTGVGSVLRTAAVEKGSSVVVIGCGAVGLSVIQGAKIAEAAQIIAIDLHENRLDMAQQYGATDVWHANRDDIGLRQAAVWVKEQTNGRGADYAFECCAVPALADAPLAMIRNGGTAVGVSGIEEEVTVDMRLFEWDKTFITSLYGRCNPSEDFDRLFHEHSCGNLLLEEMVTHRYTLEDFQQAFDDMLSGKNAKGVLAIGANL